LNNAVKHSGATEVQVTIELAPGGFKLIVADNGSGIGPKQSASAPAGDRLISGYGLGGIHKRLGQIGGRMDIVSKPGQGVRVELLVPLPKFTPDHASNAKNPD